MFEGSDADFLIVDIASEIRVFCVVRGGGSLNVGQFFVKLFETLPLRSVGIVDVGDDVPKSSRPHEREEHTSTNKQSFILHGS